MKKVFEYVIDYDLTNLTYTLAVREVTP